MRLSKALRYDFGFPSFPVPGRKRALLPLLAVLMLSGCSALPIRGTIVYSDPSGNSVSLGTDGKAIVLGGGFRGRALPVGFTK